SGFWNFLSNLGPSVAGCRTVIPSIGGMFWTCRRPPPHSKHCQMCQERETIMRNKLLVVGIGGTPRAGSNSERALAIALDAARRSGAETRMFSGPDLMLPIYTPDVR